MQPFERVNTENVPNLVIRRGEVPGRELLASGKFRHG